MTKIKNLCDNCHKEFESYNHLKYCSMECLGYSLNDDLEISGQLKTIKEWCETYNCKYHTLRYRVLTGRWDIVDAITSKPIEWSGQSKEPEYITYTSMLTRCRNPHHKDYQNYGGRGIKVCDRWLGKNGYQNFRKDMGAKPSPCHSIDRIDVNGGYSPDNCRWATIKEQANNKLNTQFVKIGGVKKSITEWAEDLQMSKFTIRHRLERGWSPEEALLLPYQKDSNGPTEDDIQKALVQWLEIKKYKFWHTPNEIWTPSWSQKVRNKELGVKSGIPDMTILIPTECGVTTLYLEIKRSNGVMSDNQKEWGSILSEAEGAEYRCVHGLNECISIIEAIQNGIDSKKIAIEKMHNINSTTSKIEENRKKRRKIVKKSPKSKNDLPY